MIYTGPISRRRERCRSKHYQYLKYKVDYSVFGQHKTLGKIMSSPMGSSPTLERQTLSILGDIDSEKNTTAVVAKPLCDHSAFDAYHLTEMLAPRREKPVYRTVPRSRLSTQTWLNHPPFAPRANMCLMPHHGKRPSVAGGRNKAKLESVRGNKRSKGEVES